MLSQTKLLTKQVHVLCMTCTNKIIHRGCELLLKDLQDIAKVIEGPQWDDSDEQNKND